MPPRADSEPPPLASDVLEGPLEVTVPSSVLAQPLLVAVADDDDDMRALVTQTLRTGGCSTMEARDGEELLRILEHAMDDPSLHPDVIVTDLRMPRLSGIGVLDAVRRTRLALPVVMLTCVSDESIHKVAMGLGAAGVLRKPFDPEDLLVAVREATQMRLSGR